MRLGGLVLASALASACGDASGAGDAADATAPDTSDASDTSADAADTDPGDCAPAPGGAGPRFEQTADRFTVSLQEGYALFAGAVHDGPPLVFHTPAETRGACRRLTYTPVACAPDCDPFTSACVAGTCRAYPGNVAVGTVTLTGLAPTPIVLEPSVVDDYAWDAEGTFAPASIGLTATGGALGAFALDACATSPPTPTGDWSAVLAARQPGQDATLRWTAAESGARIYLRMTTGIGTHGGISPVEVECEGPDTGALTLPGAFLDALYAQGWSCGECGDNRLVRYRAAEAALGDRTVQLRVQGQTTFFFRP